ncbi:hypothetical protein [Ornithinimicrobium panacihumi]|uniref:hypothetical protein n=1 Tax=Ornithinimicrobium panacihumi TaxID=2008449 RepID=UPI003F8CBCE4
MTADPRAALSDFVAALERHLEIAAVKHGDEDPNLVEAYEHVAETFSAYDDALMDAYGEVTPLDVYDEDLTEDDLDDEADDSDYDDDLDDDLDDDDEDDDDDLDDDDEDDDYDDEDGEDEDDEVADPESSRG